MHLLLTSSLVLLLVSVVVQCSCAQNTTSSIPGLAPAFSGSVDVAKPLAPIPIPGGVRVVEPLTGGSFAGPLLNGTVAGGIAFPTIFSNGTLQDAFITLYGTTSDNSSFFVQVEGVGVPMEQFARITVEVGGKSAGLASKFLLATINPSADRTTVAVSGYVAN